MSLVKTFEYDPKGNLVKEMNKSERFEGYTFEYEYDAVGNKSKETKYSIEHIPYEWFEYSYTADKEIQWIHKYDFRGNVSYKWRYLYDGKGNIEFIKIYESDQAIPVYITQYIYRYFGEIRK